MVIKLKNFKRDFFAAIDNPIGATVGGLYISKKANKDLKLQINSW